jgi:NAD+ synthase
VTPRPIAVPLLTAIAARYNGTVSQAERLAGWMRQQLVSAGSRGFVVALSGGVDSAVVLRLAQLAAPSAVLGVIMPCHSDRQDEQDAALVARHFSAPAVRLDASSAYDTLVAALQPVAESIPTRTRDTAADASTGRLPLANIKPRLRMAMLYFIANRFNYLVAGTGNRSELAVGYFTKHGDGAADLLPLGNLLKSDVRALARELGVPAAIADRPAGAGLWTGQTDEAEIGFTYEELERYLEEGPQGVAPALAMKIERLIRSSEHKRQLPPVPE